MKSILILILATFATLNVLAVEKKNERKPAMASPGDFIYVDRSSLSGHNDIYFSSMGGLELELQAQCDPSKHFQIMKEEERVKGVTYSFFCVKK